MTTFLLIRHASHGWLKRGLAGRMKGVHLTEEGRREAQSLAGNLKHLRVRAIYSSPLDRTRETAAFLAEELQAGVIYDAAFLEIDFGRWTGLSFASLEGDPEWIHWNEKRQEAHVPDGERMGDVQSRAVDQLCQLARRHEQETVAVVSHGDVIRAVLTHCLGWSLDEIHRLEVDPASVSVVRWDGDGARVLTTNHPGCVSRVRVDE